jgi:hypothetical protein
METRNVKTGMCMNWFREGFLQLQSVQGVKSLFRPDQIQLSIRFPVATLTLITNGSCFMWIAVQISSHMILPFE